MIRLAFTQGQLSQPSLNVFQVFALRYAVRMNRRVELRTIEDMLQKQTWYLEPKRYHDLFLAEELAQEALTMAGRDVEEVVDDIDEMDRYFEQLESKRGVTGAEVFRALAGADEDGWI